MWIALENFEGCGHRTAAPRRGLLQRHNDWAEIADATPARAAIRHRARQAEFSSIAKLPPNRILLTFLVFSLRTTCWSPSYRPRRADHDSVYGFQDGGDQKERARDVCARRVDRGQFHRRGDVAGAAEGQRQGQEQARAGQRQAAQREDVRDDLAARSSIPASRRS